MADINRDLERYLRKRREQPYSQPGWFEKIFSATSEEERQELTKEDREELEHMEQDIHHGEETIEKVHEIEEELEHEQEERVGLYHQIMRFFRRGEHAPRIEEDDIEIVPEEDSKDDFRKLARIYQTWLGQLPLRKKQAFMESDDYEEFREILERRGVIRKTR